MDVTPDAGMEATWDAQVIGAKRERDAEELLPQVASHDPELRPKRLTLTGTFEKADRGRLQEVTPAIAAGVGAAGAGSIAAEANGPDIGQAAGAAAAELGGAGAGADTEGLAAMAEELREAGYDEAEIAEYLGGVQAAPERPPVLVLEQVGKFNIDIFDEDLQKCLGETMRDTAKESLRQLAENAVQVAIYVQYDVNGLRHSILSVEFADRALYDLFHGKSFNFRDLSFKGVSLDEWLSKVGAVKDKGFTYAINIGPLPRAPNVDTVSLLAPLLRMYGKMTHTIFYADRTVTVGFALGDLVMPIVRKPIMLFDNGKLAGKLDPTHNIRVMGAPCCSFCPGIGEYHTGACEPNKRKQEAFLRRKKALNSGVPNMPSQKPARRPTGKRSGMRAIERAYMKENGLLVVKAD